ncbi:maleylpyruvate isomerase N-terminal domain-containing protein [Nocardioides sp.]|uniref:maleylpyruvate isomerase N-terminal domain-containing protein n=1 Tax=Nocardioides sp. TaxID=35761 RepID=UPI00273439A3|nr:maleylpyruvate isomerase N-terminal domain-containing protein [Nocardioides sp.]MDP3890464.1 maleylpyruvate isomerase N-terminal domain-containing protein [Nocardioides sp.]
MHFSWEDSRQAFADAARWFVSTATSVGDRWDQPGLGEWDVRALVGHTSRALLTVEAYLDRPAATSEIDSAADYFRATRELAAGPGVAERGREAGAALGQEPAHAVAEIADRVLRLIKAQDGSALVTTVVGGMLLSDYLPTRTFELAVHTTDLAHALGEPLAVPNSAAAVALHIVAELAFDGHRAGPLLLAATGRPGVTGSSVL